MQKERRTSIASSFLDIDKKQAPPPKKEQQEGIASKEEEEEEEEEEELTDQQKKQLKELEEEMEIGFRYFPGKIRFPNDEKNKWTPVFVGGALRRVEDRDAGIGDWTRKVHRHLQWAKQQEGLKGYSQKLEEFWEEIKKRFREKGIEVMDTIDLKDPKSIEKYKGQFQVHEQEKVPLTEPLRVRAVGFRALTGCSLHDVYDRPFKDGQLITIYGMMHLARGKAKDFQDLSEEPLSLSEVPLPTGVPQHPSQIPQKESILVTPEALKGKQIPPEEFEKLWKEEEEGLEKGIRKILASLDNFSTIFGYDYEDPDGGKAKTFYTTQIKPWKTEMDRRLNAAADMGEKNILFNEALAFEAGLKGEYFSPTKFSSLITGAENALIEGESYGRGGLIRWIIRAILEDSADSARQIVRKLEWLAVMQAMREEMQPISPAIRPGIMEIKQRFFTNPSEKTASGPTVQGKLTQALEVLDKEDLSHFCNFSTRMSKDGRWLDPNGYRIKDESKEKYQKITQYLNVMCGKNGEMSDILNSARNILEKLNRGTVLEILKPFMPKREVEV